MDFDMIRHGDRVLVAVSGGKDSLSLLDALLALQRRSPVRFEVGAATGDLEWETSVLSNLLPCSRSSDARVRSASVDCLYGGPWSALFLSITAHYSNSKTGHGHIVHSLRSF